MKIRKQTRTLLYILVFSFFLVAVVPRYDQLVVGIKEIKNADIFWLTAAILSFVLTFVSSALVYLLLAKRRLKLSKTILVQVACPFANRLLPGGLGGVGLNIDYLIKNKHKPEQATSVVAMNSSVAFVSHMLLLCIAVVLSRSSVTNLFYQRSYFLLIVALIFLLLLSISTFVIHIVPSINKKLSKFMRGSWRSFVSYKSNLGNVILAVGVASITTMFYVFCLFACANALGLSISLVQAFLVYTVAVALGAILATPGGLGSFEAGLFAGLIAYHNFPALAFSVIITFRLIIFWLPILPGYIAFAVLRRRKVI
jgi:undecaprenyl-diphosphatase